MILSRLVTPLCASLVLFACSTTPPSGNSESAGAAVAPANQVAAAEEDPVICKSVIRTGTRVAERRCMRKSDIERQEEGGQSALGDWQRRGTHTGNQSVE